MMMSSSALSFLLIPKTKTSLNLILNAAHI